jgi:anthranilate/para-aminobenzoate synthase component I
MPASSRPHCSCGNAVLTEDVDGSLDAAVALRSVFRRDGHTWLRVGAGLVEQSEPEREAQQTVEKLRGINRYLVPAAER